jgi:hypothetical protein
MVSRRLMNAPLPRDHSTAACRLRQPRAAPTCAARRELHPDIPPLSNPSKNSVAGVRVVAGRLGGDSRPEPSTAITVYRYLVAGRTERSAHVVELVVPTHRLFRKTR